MLALALASRSALLSAGVRSLVHALQSRSAHVRVDLGRLQAFVTKQFLDAANVRSMIKQMRCETVTQRVGCGTKIES